MPKREIHRLDAEPDEELIIQVTGYFSSWRQRLAILFGREMTIRLTQPVWYRLEPGGRVFLVTKPVQPKISVAPIFPRKPEPFGNYIAFQEKESD